MFGFLSSFEHELEMSHEIENGPEAVSGRLKQLLYHQNRHKMLHLVWGSCIL